MAAQNKAGFLKDITKDVAATDGNLAPTAANAFKVDGKTVGVPFDTGLVAFYYNKALFKKAGVDADAIKTWDDFLGAVKALKAAGITPITIGGGDKWPMHFYYSYLIMRIGGENALADAKAGKNGGFKNSTFVEAGKRLRELAALEPFQAGYLTTKYGQAAGMFGDGKGAMQLMFELLPAMQGPSSTNGKGLPEDDIASSPFPSCRTGKERRPTRSEASMAFSSPRAPLRRRSTSSSSSARKNTRKKPRRPAAISPYTRARRRRSKILSSGRLPTSCPRPPIIRTFSTRTRALLGRVINDVSVSVAAGQMTPEAAAAAIQDAADQQ